MDNNSEIYLSEMNKNKKIRNNRGVIEISGMSNKVSIENNYGTVLITGMNNLVTITNNFNNNVKDSGMNNKIIFSNSQQNSTIINNKKCSYCKEKFTLNNENKECAKNPIKIPCNHKLHYSCLHKIVNTNIFNCPTCNFGLA